ncbi:uncharacterized protein LOC129742922 [Uranotaenia lowii]|uniref:uncharacterized protein LOC129742922 n=1 Tax=Uranotaenia lowii TaxID=190385 RepID=UPI0024789F6E|nr:uncharacterized protein LOC129742922 [Uranotaenia lowii]
MSLSTVEDFHHRAAEMLDVESFEYFNGAAGRRQTHMLNGSSFDHIRIKPRQLMNVEHRRMDLSLLGFSFSMPLGICPTAFHKLAHQDGEQATARAAAKMGIPMIMSSLANSTIPEVAQAAPTGTRWMQIYIHRNRDITKTIVKQAEENGFSAIVLTIDSAVHGIIHGSIRGSDQTPGRVRCAVFWDLQRQGVIANSNEKSVVLDVDSSLTWKDVEWLMSITKLPVIVKGVLTKEDAGCALEIGVAAVYVSNHGGRQLDSIPATIEALPEIVSAVGGKIPILFDGGVAKGTDIFKALAYGADIVLVGRSILWGLAVDGQRGVESVLEILRNELDNTMALAGCSSLEEICRDRVQHEMHY